MIVTGIEAKWKDFLPDRARAMREMIKEIILDDQETEHAIGVPRELQITPVRGKATVCIGVRRCGKSTFMFQLMARLVEGGVPRQNILYLNFFDDRLHQLRHESLGVIMEAYYSIYPEKKHSERVYCFFDEIQAVPRWEPFVDRIMRTENCEVYLTGSSSRMLSKEIATQMRGRALSWELFPFSFREFITSKGINGSRPINKLTGYLQSLGHKAPKSTVSDCLCWFEDAYFLFKVEIFDSSLTRRNTNPKTNTLRSTSRPDTSALCQSGSF